MSDRYRDYKGSSRPSRDDSRRSKERRRHSRSRSRSPRRSPRGPRDGNKPRHRENSSEYSDRRKNSRDWEESDEEVPAPPPPPRISKISIDFSKPKAPIKMTLSGNPLNRAQVKPTVASVFNADEDDDEQEEMPAEARMRMRNIGRETPTSAGPNSFGKTKQGFCDAKKVFEKNLKEALDSVEKPIGKLPQTIYKISKGP